MDWLKDINASLSFIEEHLRDELSVEAVCRQAFASQSHFARMFNIVTGVNVGEYIRNRRLSAAARDLLYSDDRVIDVALRYGYDTPESFSKAFSRFHGVTPSDAKCRRDMLKYFYPLSINISIQGGFTMANKFMDEFYWNDAVKSGRETLSPAERYRALVNWAVNARGQNPCVFDSLTEWLLDDTEWTSDKLFENEQILMGGVFARFKAQNAELRSCLRELAPHGVVNDAVFAALDKFDAGLSGHAESEDCEEATKRVFADFKSLLDPDVRKRFAGGKTGADGTTITEIFGFINLLKELDAGVQWTLFMPVMAEKQQKKFNVKSFDYKKLPPMRFIGLATTYESDVQKFKKKLMELDGLGEYRCGFDYDVLFSHHNGRDVGTEPWHGYLGRFFKAGTPVPDGFEHVDFVQENDGKAGAPYLSRFAFAVFEGDAEAMHAHEGYDCDAMYDVTRNIMLGAGVMIPYPNKYWTGEVFIDGFDAPSSAYMFCADF